jgi:hypothetical protein
VVSAVILLAACSGTGRARRPDGIDVSSYPREVQAAYDVFEYRCSRCHSLARPLNAQIEHVSYWTDYVARMRRMPGSGINRRDADLIVRFLTYYTEHRDSGGALPFRRMARRGAP